MKRVLNGRELILSEAESEAFPAINKPLRLCDDKGTLVAVGEYDGVEKTVKPRVVVYEKV
jgi:hypothetical protein